MISPVSVEFALALALLGSGGSTMNACRRVMGLPVTQLGAVDEGVRAELLPLLSLPADRAPASSPDDKKNARGLLAALGSILLHGVPLSQPQPEPSPASSSPAPAAAPASSLAIANSVWVQLDMPIVPLFTQRAREWLGAGVRSVAFGESSATGEINGWVSEHTQGRIPKIVDATSRDDMFYLINAVYFKDRWNSQFAPHLTSTGTFYPGADPSGPDGTQSTSPSADLVATAGVPCSLMAKTQPWNYFANDEIQAVELPYRSDFSMIVLLPRSGHRAVLPSPADPSSATAVDESVSVVSAPWAAQAYFHPQRFRQLLEKDLQRARGHLELPKFKFSYEANLNEPLRSLGLDIAFRHGEANFSAITPIPVAVSKVLTRTFISVDEAGTEAAAVTAVVANRSAMPHLPQEEQFTMRVVGPFAFSIVHRPSGLPLFLGVVSEVQPPAPPPSPQQA